MQLVRPVRENGGRGKRHHQKARYSLHTNNLNSRRSGTFVLLMIKLFTRNDVISATTGLLSLLPSSTTTVNTVSSHDAGLTADVPAHKALNSQINLSPGQPPDTWVDLSFASSWLTRSRVTTTCHLLTPEGCQSWSSHIDAKALAGSVLTTTITTRGLCQPPGGGAKVRWGRSWQSSRRDQTSTTSVNLHPQ